MKRGRKPKGDNGKPLDNRILFKNHKYTTSNGDVFYFDGKFNPTDKVLKIYRISGDINKAPDLYQDLAIEYKAEKIITLF